MVCYVCFDKTTHDGELFTVFIFRPQFEFNVSEVDFFSFKKSRRNIIDKLVKNMQISSSDESCRPNVHQ